MSGPCYIGDVRDGLRSFIAAGVRAQTCVTSPPYWGLRDYGMPGQIGLEPTIAEYVTNMVDVFRLVRDVLADDGTLWLNLGDSYATGAGFGLSAGGRGDKSAMQQTSKGSYVAGPNRLPQEGLKAKDLAGIPWRVAFALQADGWYLRSDIIWHKPNPMPESVTDRPTKAHEYLFLLSKSERYYYDAAAISEEVTDSTVDRLSQPTLDQQEGSWRVPGKTNGAMKAVGTPRNDGDRWNSNNGRGFERKNSAYSFARKVEEQPPPGQPSQHRSDREDIEYKGRRNKRTVWTITTQPFSEAHFAVMPTALVEPCILAGSRVGDIVLDPFMGSGTVGQVAQDLGRRWIGCELNPAYVAMQERRTAQQGMALTP